MLLIPRNYTRDEKKRFDYGNKKLYPYTILGAGAFIGPVLKYVDEKFNGNEIEELQPNYTDEQKTYLTYGEDLIDYNLKRSNLRKYYDKGVINEKQYYEMLFTLNDEEHEQNVKLNNYRNEIKNYFENDLAVYNGRNLIYDGNWDKAYSYFSYIDDYNKSDSRYKYIYKPHENMHIYLNSLISNYNNFFSKDDKILDKKDVQLGDWYFDAIKTYCNNYNINLSDLGIYINDATKTISIPHNEHSFIVISNIIKDVYPGDIKDLFNSGWRLKGNLPNSCIPLLSSGEDLHHIDDEYNNIKNKYGSSGTNMPIHSSLDYLDNFIYYNGEFNSANGIGTFQDIQSYIDKSLYDIKSGEAKYTTEKIYDQFYNQLVGTNIANFPVWTINGNDFKDGNEVGEYSLNTNDEHRKKIKDDIAWAMKNQKGQITIRPASDGRNYGHVVYIPECNSSNRKHNAYHVFLPYFFEKNAISKYKSDQRCIAKDEIKTLEGIKNPNYEQPIFFQGVNFEGSYRIGQDFNNNNVYIYKNSNGKEFNLNEIFHNDSKKAKTVLWQLLSAEKQLNYNTKIGYITEEWFDNLLTERNNYTNLSVEEIMSYFGEQNIVDVRRSLRNAYGAKFVK